MEAVVKKGVLENFMVTHQNSFKSLFQRKKKSPTLEDEWSVDSPRPIPQLSPLANSVVARCSKYSLSLSFINSHYMFEC